jgi:hypothetical protein
MFEQKFGNNSRSVSGTVTLYNDDTTLLCDTSGGAVTITLSAIATKWSTQWRLFVVDSTGNAGTNNITINVPVGYKINGASSAVINANYGSCAIQVVSATNYIGLLSNLASTNTAVPYFYAKKDMLSAGTTYVVVAGGSVYSVLSGTQITAYDSNTNSNLSGMVSLTGIWTCPASGYYKLGAKMVTRISPTSINTLTNDSGQAWMTDPASLGFISIAIRSSDATMEVVCAEKQVVTAAISDVNIECTANLWYCTAQKQYSVYVLNKTDRDIVGMATRAGCPDCFIDFSATRVS